MTHSLTEADVGLLTETQVEPLDKAVNVKSKRPKKGTCVNRTIKPSI